MAFSKNQKELMIKQYADWIDRSRAVFVLSYSKMRMPAVNAARAKLREVDGQLHVVKNRLFTHVLDEKGYQFDPKFWEGNNVVVFAFEDAPSVAKALAEGSGYEALRAVVSRKVLTATGSSVGRLPTLIDACYVVGHHSGPCQSTRSCFSRTRAWFGRRDPSQLGKAAHCCIKPISAIAGW